ncbi:MAG: hypothetical protein Ct9H300mP1_33590 [Planctomycetaceae bacterium]|nr:MAG: hypothetical protein Ct9H300mP1_33590 [Planctomycetaceae bacterium]
MSNKCCRCWVTCGAILLGLGVIVGALLLTDSMNASRKSTATRGEPKNSEAPSQPPPRRLTTFPVGVRYHVWHALGMIAVGLAGSLAGTRNWPLQAAGICFGLGIIGFLRRTLRPGHHRHPQLRAGSSNRRHIDDRRLVPVGSRYVSLWNAIDTGPLERISTRSPTLITFFQRKPHRCPMPHS